MEFTALQKRLNDLKERCEKSYNEVASSFMTPGEVLENEKYYPDAVFTGGYDVAERKIAVFHSEWVTEDDIDMSRFISCIKMKSYFGVPSHRDYLGAILGLGISRDRVGDILVDGDTAYVFCARSIAETLETELERAGRVTVRCTEIPLSEFPGVKREFKKITFTVKSLRLDAVVSDIFAISRTKAGEAIKEGTVALNYSYDVKCDAEVKENDVISLRGKGKSRISEIGGKSRRDRLFVTAEIYE